MAVDVGGNGTSFAEDARRRRVVPQASAAVLFRQFHITREWIREHLARIHHRSGTRIDMQTCQPHVSGNLLQSCGDLVTPLTGEKTLIGKQREHWPVGRRLVRLLRYGQRSPVSESPCASDCMNHRLTDRVVSNANRWSAVAANQCDRHRVSRCALDERQRAIDRVDAPEVVGAKSTAVVGLFFGEQAKLETLECRVERLEDDRFAAPVYFGNHLRREAAASGLVLDLLWSGASDHLTSRSGSFDRKIGEFGKFSAREFHDEKWKASRRYRFIILILIVLIISIGTASCSRGQS